MTIELLDCTHGSTDSGALGSSLIVGRLLVLEARLLELALALAGVEAPARFGVDELGVESPAAAAAAASAALA